MSSYLNNQLNSFKGDVSSSAARFSTKRSIAAPSVAERSSKPSPIPPATSVIVKPELKRKRPETVNIVFSQPADTGSGKHLMTQVTYAVDYLKQKDKPVVFDDIFGYLSIPDIDLQGKRTLEHILKSHIKVDYDRKGLNGVGSFRFRPIHDVRSADGLLAFLQRQPTAQGILVRELKEGWPGAVDAIHSLETQGRILVTRNKKDATPKMVWANDPSLTHEVESEFTTMWHKIKVPANAADLRRELVDFGLTPTSVIKMSTSGQGKEKKKKAVRSGGKLTNTHMNSILRDFSHLRRA